MKRKKLLSTAVAGMLVAAQMVMPVAAADGGTVHVDVTTTKVVIRVEVPTSLEIAVNQFEKGDSGSQITSGDFNITNKSEIPVKVTVTSTVDLASSNPITLAATKAAVETSTATNGEAWLAVAAKIDANWYATGASAADKKIGSLTETSANVATFALVNDNTSIYDGKNAAEQTFYLAADTTTPPTYKDVKISDSDSLAAAKKIAYAQFYKVEEMAVQPADDDALQKLVDTKDVVLIIPGTAPTPDTVTYLKKGSTGVTKDSTTGAKYYDIGALTDISAMTSAPAQAETYIYGEVTPAASDGVAAFRYIGKLSPNKETWSATDIPKIHINYDIKGVTDDGYDAVKDECTYGLYGGNGAAATASIPATVTIPASGNITVPVTLGRDNVDLTKLEVSTYTGDMLTMGNGYGATYASGTITMGTDIATYLRGASASDLSGVTFTATFGTGASAYTKTFKFTN